MRGEWLAHWWERRTFFLSLKSGWIERELGWEKGIKRLEARLSGCSSHEPPASPALSLSQRHGPPGRLTVSPVKRHQANRGGSSHRCPLSSRGPSAADQSPISGRKAGGHTLTHTLCPAIFLLSNNKKASTEQTDLLRPANSCVVNSQSLPRMAGLGWARSTRMPSRGFPGGRLDSVPPPELPQAVGSLGSCSLEPPSPVEPSQLSCLSACSERQL